MEPETFGYKSAKRMHEVADDMLQTGLLFYHGGFRANPISSKESSRPEEMLKAALDLGTDAGLISKLRSLVAAEDIGLDPSKVEFTVALYKLDATERKAVSEVLAKYEERFGKSYDRDSGKVLRPDKPTVAEISQLLA